VPAIFKTERTLKAARKSKRLIALGFEDLLKGFQMPLEARSELPNQVFQIGQVPQSCQTKFFTHVLEKPIM